MKHFAFLFLFVFLLFTFTPHIYGQKAADVNFSGEWELTDLVNVLVSNKFTQKMTVEQSELVVKTRHLFTFGNKTRRTFAASYFTDERGEKNLRFLTNKIVETRTELNSKKLSITSFYGTTFNEEQARDFPKKIYRLFKSVETWQLSNDGNMLTITINEYEKGLGDKVTTQQKHIFTRIK